MVTAHTDDLTATPNVELCLVVSADATAEGSWRSRVLSAPLWVSSEAIKGDKINGRRFRFLIVSL